LEDHAVEYKRRGERRVHALADGGDEVVDRCSH